MSEPTITSKNLPPTQRPNVPLTPAAGGMPPLPPASVEVEIPWEQIEAKPLRAPSITNLFPVNPNISLRFVNRSVGEKESSLRYDQCLAMGFIPAEPKDVYMVNPETGKKIPILPSLCRDGRIINGDTILMKISRRDYIGALKWNAESAQRRVRRFGSTSTDGKVESAFTGIPRRVQTKSGHVGTVTAYVPPLVETDSRTADNSGIPATVNLADSEGMARHMRERGEP